MRIENRKVTLPTGETIAVRSAAPEDAASLCRHKLIVSGETYFLGQYPEECEPDIAKTAAYLEKLENSPREFAILAVLKGQVVGELSVTNKRKYQQYLHRAYLGMSIQAPYCGLGLGSLMMDIAVKQTQENGYEQLELGVFEDNIGAIHLYEKMGFQRYGVQPRAFKLKDGSYRDEIIMVKMLLEKGGGT